MPAGVTDERVFVGMLTMPGLTRTADGQELPSNAYRRDTDRRLGGAERIIP